MTDAGGPGRDATDPGAQLHHYLPEAVSREIFHRDIAPFLLAHGQPQASPAAIVLSAQPGAGKTAVSRALRAGLAASGDAVVVEVDGFKAFHPELPQLRRQLGGVAADELVHADARRWLDMALDHLAERRVNVVVEHGLRSPEVTDRLLSRFATAGYRIEAALLTTPAAVSMQGILLRYQEGHDHGGGRDIDPQLHQQRYQGLLEIADRLHHDPRVTAIRLYRRDATLVHETLCDATGQWSSPATSRSALEAERARPWTLEESQAFLTAHRSLLDRMDPSWHPRIQAYLDAAQPYLHPQSARQTPTSSTRPQLAFPKTLRPGQAHDATLATHRPPAAREVPGRHHGPEPRS